MTHDADRKRLIRARMATTGENYTTARTALLAQTPARTTIANAPERSPDEGDAAYTKHVRSFFDGDRLRAIPARRRPRASVLLHLLCRFEGGRDYAESEVNELLSRAHADYAWLRRELINYRYLIREDGRYRVTAQAPTRDANEAQEVPLHEAAVIAVLNAQRRGPQPLIPAPPRR